MDRISWDQAIDEIGDKITAIREKSGADAVYWLGSAKFTNEARLPVPEVRRVLGHELRRPSGAHLPLDDGGGRRQHLGLRRADEFLQRHPQRQTMIIMGGNPAEAHPVAMQHVLRARRSTART